MGADTDVGVRGDVAIAERVQQRDTTEQQATDDNGVANHLPAAVVRTVGVTVAVGVGVRKV